MIYFCFFVVSVGLAFLILNKLRAVFFTLIAFDFYVFHNSLKSTLHVLSPVENVNFPTLFPHLNKIICDKGSGSGCKSLMKENTQKASLFLIRRWDRYKRHQEIESLL